MSLTIRPATAADLSALHPLIERAYRGAPARLGWTHEADLLRGPRTSVAALAEIIADPAQTMLVAVEGEDGNVGAAGVTEAGMDGASGPENDKSEGVSSTITVDGTIVACVQVSDLGGIAYLGQLAVEPARQADGLGRTMLAAAEAYARGLGATRVEMTVIADRTELIAYYQRRGYDLTGEKRPFPYEASIAGAVLHMVVMARTLVR